MDVLLELYRQAPNLRIEINLTREFMREWINVVVTDGTRRIECRRRAVESATSTHDIFGAILQKLRTPAPPVPAERKHSYERLASR